MRATGPETEVSLLALVAFLKKNLVTLLLLTLVLSAVGIGLALLLPQEYQKRVTLSVTPIASPSLGKFEGDGTDGLDLEVLRPDEAGQIAVAHLREENLARISMSPRYDKDAQQIEVSLTSEDPEALREAVLGVLQSARESFQDFNEESLEAALESQRVEVDHAREVNERVASQLEEEATALPPEAPRLQALENSRASLLADAAEAEIRLEDIERAMQDLPSLAEELISVQAVDESGVSASRSRWALIALAVAGAFVAAIFVTLVLSRLRKF